MANTVLPLSSDIYLEVDGKKVAVVQSYTTRATRTSREIEAFGETEPVATIAGANKYALELSRLYATDEEMCIRDSCEDCGSCLEEIAGYCWEDGGTGHDRPKKERDHAMDEMRYFAVSIAKKERGSGIALRTVERTAR